MTKLSRMFIARPTGAVVTSDDVVDLADFEGILGNEVSGRMSRYCKEHR
jgi:hypothetical protein